MGNSAHANDTFSLLKLTQRQKTPDENAGGTTKNTFLTLASLGTREESNRRFTLFLFLPHRLVRLFTL